MPKMSLICSSVFIQSRLVMEMVGLR